MSEMINVEEIFASKVFTLGKMKERLPKNVYKDVKKVMELLLRIELRTEDYKSTVLPLNYRSI